MKEQAAECEGGIISFSSVRVSPDWPTGRVRIRLVASAMAGCSLKAPLPSFDFQYINARDVEAKGAALRARGEADAAAQHAAAAAAVARGAAEGAAASAAAAGLTLLRADAAKRAAAADADAASAAALAAALSTGDAAAVDTAGREPVPQLSVHSAAAPPSVRAYATPSARAALRPSFEPGAAVVCQAWELMRADTPQLRADTPQLRAALSLSSGLDLLVCGPAGAALHAAVRDALGPCANRLILELAAADGSFFRGGLAPPPNPQQLLRFPAISSPGFLGYLANIPRLTPSQLSFRYAPPPTHRHGAPPPAGLRESVLYCLFKDKMLFDTHAHALSHARAHPGCACLSLDGTRLERGGREYGGACPAAWMSVGGVGWAERAASPMDDATRALAARATAAREAAAGAQRAAAALRDADAAAGGRRRELAAAQAAAADAEAAAGRAAGAAREAGAQARAAAAAAPA